MAVLDQPARAFKVFFEQKKLFVFFAGTSRGFSCLRQFLPRFLLFGLICRKGFARAS